MGWSSGAELFYHIISAVKEDVADPAARERIYEKIIPVFESHDWDSQKECCGIDDAYDNVLKKLKPHWFEN